MGSMATLISAEFPNLRGDEKVGDPCPCGCGGSIVFRQILEHDDWWSTDHVTDAGNCDSTKATETTAISLIAILAPNDEHLPDNIWETLFLGLLWLEPWNVRDYPKPKQ